MNDDLMDPIQNAIQREFIDFMNSRWLRWGDCPRCGMRRDIESVSESDYLWRTHTEEECELAIIIET